MPRNRSTSPRLIAHTCPECGAEFKRYPSDVAKYCSRRCASKATQPKSHITLCCEYCGGSFQVPPHRATKARFCSFSCRSHATHPQGPANRGWRGGRHVNSGGYVRIQVDGVRHFEHRYVVEQHIGRALTSDEHVHHVNGDRTDNRIENLRVMSQSEHMRMHGLERGVPW